MSQTYQDLPYTNMPDSLDELVVYENVTESTKPIVDTFQELLDSGNFTAASNYYYQNKAILQKIIINENTINKLMQALIALERFYLNDVHQYMEAITTQKNVFSVEVCDTLPADAAQHPNKIYFTYN